MNRAENSNQPKRWRMMITADEDDDEDNRLQQQGDNDVDSQGSNPDDLDAFCNEEDFEDEGEGEDLGENWMALVFLTL